MSYSSFHWPLAITVMSGCRFHNASVIARYLPAYPPAASGFSPVAPRVSPT